jgi:bifunctional oligoribonuclease and PAP phosphatase NrnA
MISSTTSTLKEYNWSSAIELIDSAKNILLTTHLNSDGDGLGTQVAFAHALIARNKNVIIANPTEIPDVYKFLFEDLDCPVYSSPEEAEKNLKGTIDLGIIMDVSTMKRIGEIAAIISGCPLGFLVFDHHISNDMDSVNCHTFPGISSTGEVLYEFFKAACFKLDEKIAQALYVSLTTDTGGFIFPATTANTLDIAANLVRLGADPPLIHERVYQSYPVARYQLMGRFLNGMESMAAGQLIVFELTREMLSHTKSKMEHAEGFSNLGLDIQGCRISMLFSEVDENLTKVSLRCKAPYDVNAIAALVGGGGHILAAGARVRKPLQEVKNLLVSAAQQQILLQGK